MKIRKAKENDLPHILELIADDQLGRQREKFQLPLSEAYYFAFEKIKSDPNQELVVMENTKSEIVGTMQLTFIQYLTYQGGLRAQIEAVRIKKDQRGKGLGKSLFQWAIARARQRQAHLVQLTTDKQRKNAFKFYLDLGFQPTHEGMKMHFH